MSFLPSISVIIPTYNAPKLLEKTLLSLSVQSYTNTVEIIVVDDGSSTFEPDGWKDLCHPLKLCVVRLPTNRGRASARNAGIKHSQGELLVFLDGDMTVAQGFLKAHAEMATQKPISVGIGNIRFSSAVRSDAMTRYMESRGVGQNRQEEVPFKCFVTGNSSLPRSLLVKAGCFDENFTAYGGEDLELGFRLNSLGAKFFAVEKAISFHGHVRTLQETCNLMYTYGHRSVPVLLSKHPELKKLLRLDFLEDRPVSLKRCFFQFALSPKVYKIIEKLVILGLKRRIPAIFFDYLWWFNRTRGLLDAEQTQKKIA